MDDEGLAFVMRAFRHDVAEAPRYFSTHGPRRHDKPVLAAPITFIAGTADPFTPGFERRGRNWERYSSTVEVVTVADGGHYFHQHQPEAVARIIEKGIMAK
jgi:pimeloyl-ACP methyl ester carboxylesterase